MAMRKHKTLFEMRRLARKFRAFASGGISPGYAGKMNHAADELEQQADALENAAAYQFQAHVSPKRAARPAA